jgi:predicted RecA/RadA family phage recombinase
MADYVSPGDSIDYTPSSAVTAGDVIVVGEKVAIATTNISADELGSLAVTGRFKVAKATLSTSAITQGTGLYWDASGETVTETAGSNKKIGIASAAAAAAATTVEVLLGTW